MKLPICKRLLCCAEQVPRGALVADIGCDHGYLGIHLLLSGQARWIHACDLRNGPIHRAMENAGRFGTAEKMRFSLSDGLNAVSPEEVDTIVCAGMGGDLIAQILEQAPWLKNEKYLLILQPQSSGNDLRRKLAQMGFGIEKEKLVEDGGFIYYVICARFGNAKALTPGQQYLSEPLLHSGDRLLPRYVERIRRALALTVAGIRKSSDPKDLARCDYYETALREIEEMEKQI